MQALLGMDVSSGVSVVPVIDRSGSMGDNNKLQAAKQAADSFVSLLNPGDQVAAVQFDDAAQTIFPLTTIDTGSSVIQSVQQAIDRIGLGGGTSIGAGLKAAYNDLGLAQSTSRAIVLLTDGMENAAPYAEDVVDALGNGCTRIFTIGFGADADASLLQDLADRGDGQYYYAATNSDLQDIYTQISGILACEQNVFRNALNIAPGETMSQDFQVDSATTGLTTGLEWPGSTLELSLVAPDGTIISATTADPNVQGHHQRHVGVLQDQSPQAGTWKAIVKAVTVAPGGEPYIAFARVSSPVDRRSGDGAGQVRGGRSGQPRRVPGRHRPNRRGGGRRHRDAARRLDRFAQDYSTVRRRCSQRRAGGGRHLRGGLPGRAVRGGELHDTGPCRWHVERRLRVRAHPLENHPRDGPGQGGG